MVGIYFSGTGNSRYAAELFCKEYDEATKAFSLEDDNITRVVKNEEMLVFACPVQYSTVPKILRDFIIENKELWESNKVFVIATMGLFSGDGAGILGREKKICIITSNLSELFANYSDYKENQNWVMVIPLWIAALFEFYVTDKISDDAKLILLKSVDESVRADISIFLQSFWADIERKELKDGISKYIQLFEEKLYG